MVNGSDRAPADDLRAELPTSSALQRSLDAPKDPLVHDAIPGGGHRRVTRASHATSRGRAFLRLTRMRLGRQGARTRAVAALLPWLQRGRCMVTVRAWSSTATGRSIAPS